MSVLPLTGQPAKQDDDDRDDRPVDPLVAINRVITVGRLVWILVSLGSLGFGTGVGFLLGEGSARAAFAAQYEMHEKRIASAELQMSTEKSERTVREERERVERTLSAENERQERAKIIEKIGAVGDRISGVEGSLRIIAENLKAPSRRSP